MPHLAFALQIKHNHGLHYVALLRTLKASASATKRYAPAFAQAQHVLLDFIRSLSAVRKEERQY